MKKQKNEKTKKKQIVFAWLMQEIYSKMINSEPICKYNVLVSFNHLENNRYCAKFT